MVNSKSTFYGITTVCHNKINFTLKVPVLGLLTIKFVMFNISYLFVPTYVLASEKNKY